MCSRDMKKTAIAAAVQVFHSPSHIATAGDDNLVTIIILNSLLLLLCGAENSSPSLSVHSTELPVSNCFQVLFLE